MSKSIKLKNNTYLDTKGITHNKQILSDKLLLPYVLYENNNGGTVDNISLNDNINNYKYLEVYFRSNDGTDYKNSIKVDVNNLNITSLRCDHYYYGTMYSKIAEISIENNRLSFRSNVQTYHSNGSTVTIAEGNYIYVYKVIGYK